MPARPSAEQVDEIRRMFEASVDGQLYDPEEFGQFYRPPGMAAPANSAPASAPAVAPAPQPVAEATPAPAPTPEPAPAPAPQPAPVAEAAPAEPGETKSAQDILAAIRARKGQ